MATLLGKRYACEKCGTQMMVVNAGKSDLTCCGETMKQTH